MQNVDVARLFSQLADLLEIEGANPFRIRAYRSAARTIESLPESVAEIVADEDRDLQELPGIGKDLAAKIATIVETERLPQLDELYERIPTGVVDMLRIPGLGPKKVGVLFNELQLTSLDELQQAAENGQVAELKGFGKKTEQTILENVAHAVEAGQRFFLAAAKVQADEIVADLLELDSVSQATVAGSCRRRKETVGDLDVLATASDSTEAMERASKWICASFPMNPTGPRCSTSPARKNMASSCGVGRKIAG
jgi:DNA polymerase (family 10)